MKGILAIVGAALVMTITPEPTRAADPPRQCPDPSKLRGLCSMVLNQERDLTPRSSFEYLYERTIYDAGCANFETDSDELIKHKISLLISRSRSQLICKGVNFDVPEGNIYKYAISARTYGLIDKAIDEWGSDLNWIDSYDDTTLLDYVKKQIDRSRNTGQYATLNNYFNKLRLNGAKFRRELP